jgi:hypothetical protein
LTPEPRRGQISLDKRWFTHADTNSVKLLRGEACEAFQATLDRWGALLKKAEENVN